MLIEASRPCALAVLHLSVPGEGHQLDGVTSSDTRSLLEAPALPDQRVQPLQLGRHVLVELYDFVEPLGHLPGPYLREADREVPLADRAQAR